MSLFHDVWAGTKVAGLVDAHDAVYGTASGCANAGLNVALDVAGLKHFGGRANRDANGKFYIMATSNGSTGTPGVTATRGPVQPQVPPSSRE